MPTAPRSKPGAVRQPTSQDMDKGKIEAVIVDPKDQDKQIKSVIGTEQAPTLAELSPDQNTWLQFGTQLGPPFDSERVTLAQCRQIRKDPMVAFGLHYRKVPLIRAEWHIDARDNNGPNPQIAAFVDSAIRKIYARLILQRELCRDFGYQGIVKRFIFQNPGGMYIDPTEADPAKALKPSWDEGEVLPIIFKAPTALRPETAVPTFDENSGEFTGIAYTAPQGTRQSKKKAGKGKDKGVQQIDIYHAYWAVNQKDDEHGSMYGYPLVGFARDYWWSYRFLFMMANRAYERLAIPPILAYHPEGSTLVDAELQEYRPNWEIALEAAERLRSNAVAAVPSTMATAGLDASTTQREWDFKFMETPYEALTVFNERFNYLNTMKLRSVWVPELAFVGNGVGGNSAGNIAEQMSQVFDESMALAMDEIDEEINRLWIPQLLAINHPDFINNGGNAKKISHGFRPEDVEFYKQIIQLLGQTNPEMLAQVDLVEIFRRINTPLKNPEALEAERARLVQESLAAVAPQVPPTTGQVGVIRNPNANPGVTSGGSSPKGLPPAGGTGNGALGFGGYEQSPVIYVAGPEHIDLSDVDDFLANLPASHHYTDKTIRALMLQLRRLWLGYYRNLYPDVAEHISRTKLELSDLDLTYEDQAEGAIIYMMFANGNSKRDEAKRVTKKMADKATAAILKSWQQQSEKLEELREKSANIMRKVMARQFDLTKRETGLQPEWDDKVDDIEEWLNTQTARLIRLTSQTVRDELRAFIGAQIIEGKSAEDIADEIRAHFTGFEGHKADRVARSEIRDAVNAATLLNGEQAKVRYARATDGELFDAECADRNGKLLTIKEAWRELRKEHPYGTLGFKLLPRLSFSVETVTVLPEGAGDDPDTTAWFDSSTDTAWMLMEQPQEDKEDFLKQVGELVMA